jgi:hypothetical protein
LRTQAVRRQHRSGGARRATGDPRLNADFPQLGIVTAINNARYIERSIENVSRSILYGGSLALLVLLFFLRNLRFTLVAATAIPVSVIATFMLIYFGGFTLNLMTLGGLALGVGLMVDNAIVVIENIARRRSEDGLAHGGRGRRHGRCVGGHHRQHAHDTRHLPAHVLCPGTGRNPVPADGLRGGLLAVLLAVGGPDPGAHAHGAQGLPHGARHHTHRRPRPCGAAAPLVDALEAGYLRLLGAHCISAGSSFW